MAILAGVAEILKCRVACRAHFAESGRMPAGSRHCRQGPDRTRVAECCVAAWLARRVQGRICPMNGHLAAALRTALGRRNTVRNHGVRRPLRILRVRPVRAVQCTEDPQRTPVAASCMTRLRKARSGHFADGPGELFGDFGHMAVFQDEGRGQQDVIAVSAVAGA